MCGRGRFALSAGQVAAACGLPPGGGGGGKAADGGSDGGGDGGCGDANDGSDERHVGRENYGPGMEAWIVCGEPDQPRLHRARWGLVRGTHKGPVDSSSFFRMFNARADRLEVVHPTLLPSKRCVVVFNGFFEWQKKRDPLDGKDIKQPYYVFPSSEQPLCMAGLFDTYQEPDGELLRTFSIITVPAAKSLAWLHDRMPAVLPDQEAVNRWLAVGRWSREERALLVPKADALKWHPVTKAMGSTKFQDPSCCEPVKLPKPLPSVKDFFGKKRTATAAELKSETPEAEPKVPRLAMPAAAPASTVKKEDGKAADAPQEAPTSGARQNPTNKASPTKRTLKRDKAQSSLTTFFGKRP